MWLYCRVGRSEEKRSAWRCVHSWFVLRFRKWCLQGIACRSFWLILFDFSRSWQILSERCSLFVDSRKNKCKHRSQKDVLKQQQQIDQTIHQHRPQIYQNSFKFHPKISLDRFTKHNGYRTRSNLEHRCFFIYIFVRRPIWGAVSGRAGFRRGRIITLGHYLGKMMKKGHQKTRSNKNMNM